MFFIMGMGQDRKQLPFDQLLICKCCQKYGHVNVFMTYSYFSFFFIPLFKWNKQYYAQMTCCGATCPIDPSLGREIEKGTVTSFGEDFLQFQQTCHSGTYGKVCANCGFQTTEDFEYCPKCGQHF